MKKLALAMFAFLAFLPLSATPARAKTSPANAKKYHAEHAARVQRHRKLTPAQRHARMVRYAKEHQARQHRHRAAVKAKSKKH